MMSEQKEISLEEPINQSELFYCELIELFGLHSLDEIECAIHQIKSRGIG
jgi:hypothetical protein